MTNEDRAIIAVCIICITIIICACTKLHNDRVKMFINAGYTQKTIAGYSEPVWTKD